jgi:patatin-like phospholipase/acyl hydrolase
MNGSPTTWRRVLSIDGGGIKGVFAASFLAEIEESLGEPLVDYFDLIAGTSTGGIIALGLGMGLTAKEILAFYETHGPDIFRASPIKVMRWLWSAKYKKSTLENALVEVFGERLLGESKTRLMIPSLDLETGAVHVFKTAHHDRFVRDYHQRVVDVALSTAAAPTYFPTHTLEAGVPLVDGGMWANNPMGPAAVEAIGLLEWEKGSVRLLSVGCTESPLDTYDRSSRGLGLNYWAQRLMSVIMAGQSSASLGTAQLLLGSENVHRVSPKVSPNRYKLDGVEGIQSLRGLGSSQARIEFQKVKNMFLDSKVKPFVPKLGRA